MNVRPSWITLKVDGKARIATGPRARSGTLDATLSVRDKGTVLPLLDIDATATDDGSLLFVSVTDRRTGRVIYSETFEQ